MSMPRRVQLTHKRLRVETLRRTKGITHLYVRGAIGHWATVFKKLNFTYMYRVYIAGEMKLDFNQFCFFLFSEARIFFTKLTGISAISATCLSDNHSLMIRFSITSCLPFSIPYSIPFSIPLSIPFSKTSSRSIFFMVSIIPMVIVPPVNCSICLSNLRFISSFPT